MNWSEDNKMILIYGDNSEFNLNKDVKEKVKNNKALINKPFFFYPDSMNIVYIKVLFNILNILSLSKKANKKKKCLLFFKI